MLALVRSRQVGGDRVQPAGSRTQPRLVTKCNCIRHTPRVSMNLTSDERREVLLDVTRDLLLEGGRGRSRWGRSPSAPR